MYFEYQIGYLIRKRFGIIIIGSIKHSRDYNAFKPILDKSTSTSTKSTFKWNVLNFCLI